VVTITLADATTHKVVETLTGTPTHPFFTTDGLVAKSVT
jgi:hypothetical protein